MGLLQTSSPLSLPGGMRFFFLFEALAGEFGSASEGFVFFLPRVKEVHHVPTVR